ncbi:MAG TPA: adenylate/guanylate cyclase domain-containing protein [Gammaproteobacteria bacterium]|nr:adenylate/guanylate cyclase domain-containing protein [Gammaproteobacteria bacterium]
MAEQAKNTAGLWDKITRIGAAGEDYSETRRIVLTNQVALLGIVVPQLYNLFYVIHDFRRLIPVIVINIVGPLFYLLVFILNAKGIHNIAKLIICLVPNIQIFLLTFYLGTGTGMHLLHIMMISFIFFVLSNENRYLLGLVACIPVILFVFSYLYFIPELSPIMLDEGVLRAFYISIALTVFLLVFLFFYLFYTEIVHTEGLLQQEHERSEKLLLNILPKKVAERLKENSGAIAELYPSTTILFADIVGFTGITTNINPTILVSSLNRIFSHFDGLVEKYGLEKIKTIGDAYMVAGGLPEPVPDHVEKMALLALDIIEETKKIDIGGYQLGIRIGFHTGNVVAGVIGRAKFSYDTWGEAVNLASRLESHGMPGKIHVSNAVYEILQRKFAFESRGPVNIKGLGEIETFYLTGRR